MRNKSGGESTTPRHARRFGPSSVLLDGQSGGFFFIDPWANEIYCFEIFSKIDVFLCKRLTNILVFRRRRRPWTGPTYIETFVVGNQWMPRGAFAHRDVIRGPNRKITPMRPRKVRARRSFRPGLLHLDRIQLLDASSMFAHVLPEAGSLPTASGLASVSTSTGPDTTARLEALLENMGRGGGHEPRRDRTIDLANRRVLPGFASPVLLGNEDPTDDPVVGLRASRRRQLLLGNR